VLWSSRWSLHSITGTVGTAYEAARRCKGAAMAFPFPSTILTFIDAFSSLPSARSLAISFFFDLFTAVFLLITSVMRCAAIFSWGFTLLTEKPEENMRACCWVGVCRREREERCVRIPLEGEHRVGV